MKKNNEWDALRERAERRLTTAGRQDIAQMSTDDIAVAIHDLETHRIELEMQNEELRQAQASLVEARDQYAELYDFAPAGYLTLDEKGLIIQANLTLADMLGVSREKLIRQHLSAYVVAEDQDVYFSHKRNLLETHKKSTCELRLSAVDGESLWVEITSIVAEGSNGDGGQIRSILRDITKRKQAEKERETAYALLQSVLDGLPEQVMMINRDYTIAMANRMARNNGTTPSTEVIGLKCYEVSHGNTTPCGGDQHPCPMEDVLKTKRVVMVEHLHHTADGVELPVEVVAAPIFDENGEVVQVIESVRDISERKRVAKESARLARFPAEDPYPVLRVSVQGVLDYANEASECFISTLGAEVGGRINAEWQERIQEVLKGARPEDIQVQVEGRMFSVTLAPVMQQGYVNLYASDITEALHVEDQLRQAQKMEAIGHLVGGIAHDFNNILQAINGFAGLALDTLDPSDEVHGHVTQIAVSGERAAVLVRQLLAFSRQQVIRPVDLDLNEVIAEGVKMLQRTLAENIEFEFIPTKKLDSIHVDRGQIEQVLMNLCVNARDAMPDGGKLTIKTENLSAVEKDVPLCRKAVPGRCVLLSITDTGCGMSKETMDQIFEPFFTTKGVGKGTGLGLATVFGIMKQNNGHVEVKSQEGQGTVFSFYFPASVSVAQKIVRPSNEASVGGGTETILLAEDDVAILALAEHTLRGAGYTVLSARDGEEALTLYKKHAAIIDMALFDVMMPRMDGKEAMKAILKLRPGLPYLFVSGYSGIEVHTGFIKENKSPILTKPYRSKELLRKVRDVLT